MTIDRNHPYIINPLDHGGHADCFVADYPNLFRFSATRGWLVYQDGFWGNEGAEASIGRGVEKMLRARKKMIPQYIEDEAIQKAMKRLCVVSASQVNSIKTLLKSRKEIELKSTALDTHITLFNCKNGVVDLETGKLLPHAARYLFTHRAEVDYDPDAADTNWRTFLDSLGMSPEVLEYLRRVAGYALTGLTDEEVMFYLYGATRTGKGTFTNALLGVMGQYSMGINFRTFTVRRDGDTQNFDLAILAPKRFLSASESKRNERINSSVFKQVTGGDPVFASLKGKDGFSFIPQWKVMLSSNYPLNADPMDAAVWARVNVIRFNDSKLGKEDKTLKRKLSSDDARKAILAWAVSGAVDWHKSGLEVPKEITINTRRMRLEASSVLLFIDQCCKLMVDSTSDGKALYAAYVEWAIGEGYKPFGRTSFTQSLEQVGCYGGVRKQSGKATRYYTHIEFAGDSMGDQSISNRIEVGIF